ncbi:hypothetical protein [Chengkuizengella marina]|uniref:Uncharacterized protein n=1 Tax=Chengkuizengella marina TaxID=2507566 RepID=A0A6N9Q7Y3_9BACL|nr:hypothetical protein [Chengkuizengella marina]NBI31025.1 hypothetical protein [Chengkuizengella marina]
MDDGSFAVAQTITEYQDEKPKAISALGLNQYDYTHMRSSGIHSMSFVIHVPALLYPDPRLQFNNNIEVASANNVAYLEIL